jgi:hypothetical protein
MKKSSLQADIKLCRTTPSAITLPIPVETSPTIGDNASRERVFLHMEYNIDDIPWKAVRSIIGDTCSGVLRL